MSAVPKVKLSGGLEICRIVNGMWQLSGAHGKVDRVKAGDLHCGCHCNVHTKGRTTVGGGYFPKTQRILSAVNWFTVAHLEIQWT